MKKILVANLLLVPFIMMAQNTMTPELLWKLGRITVLGISKDKKQIIYTVATPNIAENKSTKKTYALPIAGGESIEISNSAELISNKNIAPGGKYELNNKEVSVKKLTGSSLYPDLPKSNVYVYDDLAYRHWDTWEDGNFDHVFLKNTATGAEIDIMAGEPYDCPTKPFGGDEDYVWHSSGKWFAFVTKKKYGKEYALSTNTDIYAYDVLSNKISNLTEDNKGYDVSPAFNTAGVMAWMQMRRDGFEADKQDLVCLDGNKKINLTAKRDDIHVEGFKWSEDGKSLFFWAPINGTLQLFQATYAGSSIKQITQGDFDINGIIGQVGNKVYITRTDINHAAEIYSVDLDNGQMAKLSHVNDPIYNNLALCKTERRFVKTTDGKQMLVWVIYPPGFDPTKKYPALLYCQGGPQSPLTQYYSYRWNFQLMASQGYIVVAPNRRGMPGHGTKWNEQISKDHGGQAIQDYLSAIDHVSKEPFVDKNRLGCVGASYGGYSVFMLASLHNKRFKTFIAHDGIFDTRSMYGTTEELWFVNWDYGGPYWDKQNALTQKAYTVFNPSNFVDKWNTPIMIVQGGKDYRVPIEQGLQAFQAAQLRGIKSKLVYLPDENHWVLSAQNAQVWQREFYAWLKETL